MSSCSPLSGCTSDAQQRHRAMPNLALGARRRHCHHEDPARAGPAGNEACSKSRPRKRSSSRGCKCLIRVLNLRAESSQQANRVAGVQLDKSGVREGTYRQAEALASPPCVLAGSAKIPDFAAVNWPAAVVPPWPFRSLPLDLAPFSPLLRSLLDFVSAFAPALPWPWPPAFRLSSSLLLRLGFQAQLFGPGLGALLLAFFSQAAHLQPIASDTP